MKITELQSKDVINIADGRKLGQIHDLEIDMKQGLIRSIILPTETRLFGWISGGDEITIPWRHIVKIGSDVILVRLEGKLAELYQRSPVLEEDHR